MVARIKKTQSLSNAVNYIEKKVQQHKAECLAANVIGLGQKVAIGATLHFNNGTTTGRYISNAPLTVMVNYN
jgi:hypothetical protein